MIEYRSGSEQRKKYILFPGLKLISVMAVATLVSIFWFKVGTEQLLICVVFTWCWVGLIHLLPFFIIAHRHVRVSRDSVLHVDEKNGVFIYQNSEIRVSFTINQIDKVSAVLSPPKYDKRIDLFGFGHFFYWKIVLQNKQVLELSCLLVDDEIFSSKIIEHEKRVFVMPSLNRKLTQ